MSKSGTEYTPSQIVRSRFLVSELPTEVVAGIRSGSFRHITREEKYCGALGRGDRLARLTPAAKPDNVVFTRTKERHPVRLTTVPDSDIVAEIADQRTRIMRQNEFNREWYGTNKCRVTLDRYYLPKKAGEPQVGVDIYGGGEAIGFVVYDSPEQAAAGRYRRPDWLDENVTTQLSPRQVAKEYAGVPGVIQALPLLRQTACLMKST